MEEDKKHLRRPADNAFQQQKLSAWQPLLTPFWVITTFVTVGILFLILGFVIKSASDQVVETKEFRYDNNPDCKTGNCTVNITIEADMDAPIFFYYKLENFYQNHRRYVKSRSDSQLQGTANPDISGCDPLITWPEGSSQDLYPCGLIANSYFNDTFSAALCRGGQNCNPLIKEDQWREDGIAWDTDVDVKFKDTNPPTDTSVGPQGFKLPNVTDEHFINWMRTAGLPTFKKLYARLPDTSFKKGDVVQVTLTNDFVVEPFDGKKYFVFTTLTWLGGKNVFLAYSYIVVGSLCLVMAAAFQLKHMISPRKLGDMRYFNWPGSEPMGTS